LRQLADVELMPRAKVIKGLPRDLCPDSKITPQLAANRSLRLHPIVFALDEAQEAFSHPGHGAAFDRYATALTKRGPAMGIILVLATQRPDAKSLPTGVTSNASIRFCLRVTDQVANDMVLGTSSYKRGVNATLLTVSG
jgi:S-DNA-T family DNA segregation ATPase FtsK/SpoIIIE